MINNKYSAKQIVPKLLDKILKSQNSLMEYIRNYANTINDHRLKLLKKIGIKKNKLTNLVLPYYEEKKIFDYIVNKTTIN